MRSRQDSGPPSAQSPSDSQHGDGSPSLIRFTLSRGPDERPLQFDGQVLAEAEAATSANVLRAAIYRTKSGKHVSEFSRRDEGSTVVVGKVEVFDTLDEALSWFRPGKLTVALRKQLGRWEAEVLDESATTAGENQMPSTDELLSLLETPVETLSVEYKGWLDLGETRDRATLAKAAIAIANHGGGVIVLGMSQMTENGPLLSVPPPPELDRYTQDDVNQSINRFADPEFHCELSFATPPTTKVEHAFVSVPGNMTVPVMSRRDCEGVIAARRCYIRKPGPRSEEPFDAQEWRTLLDRCVLAGRESMLDSIRAVVQGRAGSIPRAAVGEKLTSFMDVARRRWKDLTANLPEDDDARFPFGRYELGFELLSAKPLPSLSALREAMAQANLVKHTGWGPFLQMGRTEFEPRIVDGAIEAWIGYPAERMTRDAAHCDYWRADTSGRLALLRGYDEDGGHRGHQPGTMFDVTIPVWRVGEAILFVGRLAEHFGDNPSFLVRCRYLGLRGRALTRIEHRATPFWPSSGRCSDDEVVLERQITRVQARDNLVEVLHGLLSPLYERFSFFQLPANLVAEEVERLISGRF